MNNQRIYADHAATTSLSPAARAAMLPFLEGEYGNPSTLYALARKPRRAVAEAREVIAGSIGAKPQEIFFTSGGTEAVNWAIKGYAFRHFGQKKKIITSAIEHHAVLNTCASLRKLGYETIRLPVNQHGIVSERSLENAIDEGTLLVSIMLANNEIGTIEPISELAKPARRRGVCFHTDAVQAVGHIPIDVTELTLPLEMLNSQGFSHAR